MSEWMPIEMNTAYEVSDAGEVRRSDTKRLVGQFPNDQGYMLVRFSQPRKTVRVHRLVAQAFIPNPSGLPFVNHKDCIRNNNAALNLEWCTQWENLNHSQQLGRMQRDYCTGKRSPSAKLTDEQAAAIRAEYAKGGKSWEEIGKLYGVSKRTAGRIIQEKTYV